MESRNVEVIQKALEDALGDLEEVSEEHAMIPAVMKARELLIKLPLELKLIDTLKSAIESNDIFELDEALHSVKEFGDISDLKELRSAADMGQKHFNKLVALADAKRQLDMAIHSNRVDLIENAITNGKLAGIDSGSISKAMALMNSLKKQDAMKKEIKSAIMERNEKQLEKVLSQAKELTMEDTDVYKQGQAVLASLSTEKNVEKSLKESVQKYKKNPKDADYDATFESLSKSLRIITTLKLELNELKEDASTILSTMKTEDSDRYILNANISKGDDYFSNLISLTDAIKILDAGIAQVKAAVKQNPVSIPFLSM